MQDTAHTRTGRPKSSPTTARLVWDFHEVTASDEDVEDAVIIVDVSEELWIHRRIVKTIDDPSRPVWHVLQRL